MPIHRVRRASRAGRARERRPPRLPWPWLLGGIAVAALLAAASAYVLTRRAGRAQPIQSRAGQARPRRPRIQVHYADEEVARWGEQLDAPDLRTRTAAAHALAALGPRATEAVPALLDAMSRPAAGIEFDVAVDRAIKAIGPAAVPGLAAALKSDDPTTRSCAAAALGKLGPHAAAAVGDLIAALERDPRSAVRSTAAWALGAIGPAASAAVPALRKALGSPNARLTSDPAQGELRVRAQVALTQIAGGP